MKLTELLRAIEKVANDKGLSKPYIVGGLVRDKLLNRPDTINDVDLTTGDQSIRFLAAEIASRLEDHPKFSYDVMTDGHAKIGIDDFKIDFSSNFKVPGIDSILRKVGIEDPTEMQKELYSRDFTCNAGLMTLDFKKVEDPTGLAVKDIEDKVVRTLLPPELTLGYNNNRIVRVIYMAAKLGFDVDSEIKQWIKDHPELIANSRPDYIGKKLKKAAEFSPDIAGNLLTELGLWKYVPLIPELIKYQKEGLVRSASKKKKKKSKKSKDKKRVDKDVRPYPNPFFSNYDYGGSEAGGEVSPGTGLYSGDMSKYKSTKDFIEKSRKRRRKAFTKILQQIKTASWGEDIDDKIRDLGERNARPFDAWFGGKDRVYIPFAGNEDEYDDSQKEVIEILKETFPEKCPEVDFINGYCVVGNNKYRIGKLINSAQKKAIKEIDSKIQEMTNSYNEEGDITLDSSYISLQNERQKVVEHWKWVMDSFTNAPSRARSSEKAQFYIAFSQDPMDIAYMSTGRNWESCMTLPVGGQIAGTHHEDVYCEVEEGGFIAYLIRANDLEIKDPMARIRIRRFENNAGNSFAKPEETVYGDDVAGFEEAVQSWVAQKQKAAPPGIYKMRGGNWSDTFSSNSMVVAPQDEESLIGWMAAPEDHGAVINYWAVVDVLKREEPSLFDEDNDGTLADLSGETPSEKIFYDEYEADNFCKILNGLEHNWDVKEALQSLCERNFRYNNGEGADYDERMSPEEIEDAINDGKHLKECHYGQYLSDDFERFVIEKRENNRTSIMQRAVVNQVLESPSNYGKQLKDLIKDFVFNKDDYGLADLQNKFISELTNEYPDLAQTILKDHSNKSLKLLAKYHKSLKDGDEKDNTGQVIQWYINQAFDEGIKDEITGGDYGWYQDRISLLGAFNPIPANLATKAIEFANKANESEIDRNHKINLLNAIIHEFGMSGTDIPAVQRFYQSRLPYLEIIPITTHSRVRQGLDKRHTLDDLGWAIAKLGENGKSFIPFLKEKIQEVKNYSYDLYSLEEYTQQRMKQPFGSKDPEAIKKEYEKMVQQKNKPLIEMKKKQIEKLLYIIDSIESGKGYSTKYNR